MLLIHSAGLLESFSNVLLGRESLLDVLFQSLLFLNLPRSVSRHNSYWIKLTKAQIVL